MPAATDTAGLLVVTAKEWAKLEKVMARFDPDSATRPAEDGICARDIIAHRAHWIGLFFQWQAEAAAGKPVLMPDHGVKWSELVPYSARLRAAHAALTWAAACDGLHSAHLRLHGF